MRKTIAAMSMLFVGVLLAPLSAQATTLAGGGFSFDVTANVKPERLPNRGSAPVTLAISGSLATAIDRTQLSALRLVEVRLDKQLALNSKGLATCETRELLGLRESQARKRCGKALVGSGILSTENTFDESPPYPQKVRFLLFKAKGGKLLTYLVFTYQDVPASIVATGTANRDTLRIAVPQLILSGTTAFQARIGRTWRDNGRKRSYLSGRCGSGKFSNRVSLKFVPNTTLTGAVPANCTRSAGS